MKLWDAFERIKTLEPGANKKESAAKLLDRASVAPKFRSFLDSEARQLTDIGNHLRIRHAETTTEPLQGLEQVDNLFHRMFGFVYYVLRMTGRASSKVHT